MQTKTYDYILGLDLGIASVGWAVVEIDINDKGYEFKRLIDTGVRIFPAAEHPKNKESLAKNRREARSARRVIGRRKARLKRLKQLLVNSDFLTKEDLHQHFNSDPYYLRSKGLDEQLTDKEIARVILHILKRRGFKSNRKDTTKQEGGTKEYGKIIINTREKLNKYRTIGEMLYKDKEYTNQKTNKNENYIFLATRAQLKDELFQILKKQQQLSNHKITDDFVNKVISEFEQLSYAKNGKIKERIGRCTFEKDQLRAPKASVTNEKFVLLNKLSTLKLYGATRNNTLTTEEKRKVYEIAFDKTKITYKQIRKVLDIDPNNEFVQLRFEYDAEKKKNKTVIPSEYRKKPENQTFFEPKGYNAIRKALKTKEYWNELKDNDKLLNDIANNLTWYKDTEEVKKHLQESDPFFAEQVITDIVGDPLIEGSGVDDSPFNKVGHLSIIAIKNIIPHFIETNYYSEACEKAGYEHSLHDSGKDKKMLLPAVDVNDLTNPVMIRTVTQTRKVVNAVIKKYGSPTLINIELARELSKTKEQRKQIENDQKSNRSKNIKLKEDLAEMCNINVESVSGRQLLMYKLYKEQRFKCAYSLKQIDANDLFSDANKIQIDHILPRSKTLNESYLNKVLVFSDANQNKRDRTPLELLRSKYGEESEEVRAFISDVESNPNYKTRKKDSLLAETTSDIDAADFCDRNLADTRYISKFTHQYIKDTLKFNDANLFNKKRRIYTVNGAYTATIRRLLGIKKDREESHRHHAIDAIVVALAKPLTIRKITTYLKHAKEIRQAKDVKLPQLWNNFRNDINARVYADSKEEIHENLNRDLYSDILNNIQPMFVSRMPRRKLRGKTNEDTIYSPRLLKENKLLVRKPISEIEIKKDEQVNKYYLDGFAIDTRKKLIEYLKRPVKERPEYFEHKGNIVKKIITIKNGATGMLINNETQFVANGAIIRLDVYKNDDYYLGSPVYAHKIRKGVVKNPEVCLITVKQKKDFGVDKSDRFVAVKNYPNLKYVNSIYPNDYIICEMNDAQIKEGYYVKFDISTGVVTLVPHDKRANADPKKGEVTVSWLTLHIIKKITKITIDQLGNKIM